jgi:scyllo-inositol 2-dehydrogenase (NADP+)
MLPLSHAPRAVVVGYGFAGRSFHAYLLSITPGLELHGIMARSPEAQAKIRERGDCRLYLDFEEVLADPGVDLVVLATPNEHHAPLAIAALNAGKNVVTDKPMCLDLAQCDAMIEAAHQSNRLLATFQNRRWDGDFLTARQLMEDGALGEMRWIEMAWQNFGAPGHWRGQSPELGGGRLFDLGAHLLDQMLQLFPGSVEGVYCRQDFGFPDRAVESECLVALHFEDGRTGVCDISSRCAIKKPRFTLHGERATWQKFGLDPQERAMIDGDIDAAREDPELFGTLSDGRTQTRIETLPGRWRSFYENIRDALRGDAPLEVTPQQTRRVMAVLDAARESSRTGQVVKPLVS